MGGQTHLLKRLRNKEYANEEERQKLQDALVVTINGISAGMRNSGTSNIDIIYNTLLNIHQVCEKDERKSSRSCREEEVSDRVILIGHLNGMTRFDCVRQARV